ncbi:DUF1311 domain-containing protein [Lysobacter sp. 5GHs7-4]|uniref:lysozyme inhibitor LprI family protein n=1 Tax=Lysobacter sp. 5GHs7-4 TaxID=2904253 RepID=UPI001E2B2749|nr:lysozyme inhibitor LprI family protein [Lysobacter sp. 5GHs7-4]UHQ24624.1 DUF1311 domain-containing protein [Lysobacter sp. 5GHs7-4]
MKTITMRIAPLLLALPLQAMAANPSEYDRLYDACVDKLGPINNAVVDACSNQVSTSAKAEITRRYKTIHARLSEANPDDAAKFEASQKAWLNYRNAHCELAGSYIGSPMYGFCPMKLNTERALELRELDGE